MGPEFGASVGIVFAFANAVSASMNTIGFCNSLSDLLNRYGLKIIDAGINDARIIGVVAIFVMILICAIGMEWESKAQNILIVAIVAAIVDFLVGAIIGPLTDKKQAEGFTGFNCKYTVVICLCAESRSNARGLTRVSESVIHKNFCADVVLFNQTNMQYYHIPFSFPKFFSY